MTTQTKKKIAKEISFDNVCAIAITDTHFSKENLEEVINIFEQFKGLALRCKVEYVFHLGDVFTNRVGQSLQTLLAFKTVLDSYKKAGLTLIAIPGNHDKTDLDSDDSYLDVFSNFDNFELIKSPTTAKVNGDIKFHFLPYFHNTYKDKLREFNIDEDKINILCTHQAINGVKNNDGTEVTDCESPEEFSKFDKVLVGHYHNASKIGNNIHYIGSSHQSNFGETISDKGFTIIYNDGSLAKYKSKFKKYIKIKLDVNDIDSIESALKLVDDHEEANYRFIFGGDKTDLDNLNLTKFTERGIQVLFENSEMNSEILKAENEELLQFDKGSLTKHLIKFSKLQNIESGKRNIGLKFMKELL